MQDGTSVEGAAPIHGSDRRAFLGRLAAVGAAAVYTSPRVLAYSPASALSPTCGVFNVQLPANYAAAGVQTFQFVVPGLPAPVPVDFTIQASVSLVSNGSPCSADVVALVQGTSVSPNPLGGVGIQTGQLSGTYGGSTQQVGTVGRLNLTTGVFEPAPAPVPFVISSLVAGTHNAAGTTLPGHVAPTSAGTSTYTCKGDFGPDPGQNIPMGTALAGSTLQISLVQMDFYPVP